MAWRRLGVVALQVAKASAAAAAQRESALAPAAPRECAPAEGPALFTRVAVISGPVADRPSVSVAA